MPLRSLGPPDERDHEFFLVQASRGMPDRWATVTLYEEDPDHDLELELFDGEAQTAWGEDTCSIMLQPAEMRQLFLNMIAAIEERYPHTRPPEGDCVIPPGT